MDIQGKICATPSKTNLGVTMGLLDTKPQIGSKFGFGLWVSMFNLGNLGDLCQYSDQQPKLQKQSGL